MYVRSISYSTDDENRFNSGPLFCYLNVFIIVHNVSNNKEMVDRTRVELLFLLFDDKRDKISIKLRSTDGQLCRAEEEAKRYRSRSKVILY